VVVPTDAWTGQIFLAFEPIDVFPRTDRAALERVVRARLHDPIPVIPHPVRSQWPKPVYLRPSGFRSDKAFGENLYSFSITVRDGRTTASECYPEGIGRWVSRPDLDGASEDQLIEAAWTFIQSLPPPKVITKPPRPRKPKA
jgi:hypothetical protein